MGSRSGLFSPYFCSMTTGKLLFLESLGGGELLVIFLFVLVFFGSKNIPGLARGLGKAMREFKDAVQGVQSEINQGMRQVEEETVIHLEAPPKKDELKEDQAELQKEKPAAESLPEIQPEERSASR